MFFPYHVWFCSLVYKVLLIIFNTKILYTDILCKISTRREFFKFCLHLASAYTGETIDSQCIVVAFFVKKTFF